MHPLSSTPWYSPWESGLFSLAVFTAMVLVFIVAMLAASAWVGQRRPSQEKCGPMTRG
jgi:NADH:ubiquinone oxidoreductase subunit 3 (subunit A)